jgi:hypothetical protein
MHPAEIATKKSELLIAYAKEKMGSKCPGNIDSMERSDLLALVKGLADQEVLEKQEAPRAAPSSETAPKSPEKEVKTEYEALDALRVMGFESKDQVKAYLTGVEREKGLQKVRILAIEEAQKSLDMREVKLNKREEDMDVKGKQILDDLLELRKVRIGNQELVRQRESLSKLI